MGTAVLVSSSAGFDYGALSELDGNDVQTITDPKTLTKFIGQVGASFILASLQYNPWVALHSEPIAVTSPQLAICYHGPYFWGFLPLVAAAVIVIGWALVILFKVHYESLGNMGRLYGGLYPYWGVVRPEAALDDVVLVWEKNPDSDSERPPLMRLEVVSEDIPSAETTGSTAVDYLASTLQHKVRHFFLLLQLPCRFFMLTSATHTAHSDK
jgi:hypothetical protein